ncbi:TPA: large-conductance mechanosensitive channel protein MscL [Legionella pneumophila subsp. pneumophila]|uniref:large-conductance mechanosensitive channel protein MscL n=1 Tax=Legionella pneumophila TaxID=446 RepID=UPI0001E3C6AE|nr:large-conductance mechanosensitive channel protein MscL [Legionella pneumophila]MDC8031115.1 large-conductance mechanosensitive channel protein MscL [Legionella pneumophila subsp. pneumophila]MDW8870385.1 large-conductance mechanosensitive channel protein MscL [Legionella pneumophila]MDW8916511.1 large-conductance mechanosensitive channel protein MscL [Legionella pneumophila]MDW8925336.1 large-conductance mechanosensitive channel protein MscL [Legionella pneumophila]MDW8932649.1 large-condu
MSLLKEFKEFAMRGNVMDLAVAVVMGVAFNKIITALVDGIIMPCVGLLLGGVNIAGLSFTVGDAQIKWGNFLQNVIDFIIVAFAIFVLIKLINLLQRKKANEPEPVTLEIQLLTEIRDLLARNSSKI